MNINPTIDHSLMLALNNDMGSIADMLMWSASSKIATVPLVLFTLWCLYRQFGWKNMVLAIVIIALMVLFADQISNFFKHNVSRLRPTQDPAFEGLLHTVNGYIGGKFGTVSAHAANSIAVLGFCSLLVRKYWFTVISVFLCITICYSRIYLGVHYPLDILWGILLGIIIAISGNKLYVFVKNKLK